jgi:hypothetical protein
VQVSLLEPDADQDVARAREREQQVPGPVGFGIGDIYGADAGGLGPGVLATQAAICARERTPSLRLMFST